MWVTGKSREMFGPEHDVPMTEVEKTPMLEALHADLATVYSDVATLASAHFPVFRPHVTDNGGAALKVGGTEMLRSISLVERQDENWLVRHTFHL
jgi:hypothetical protein